MNPTHPPRQHTPARATARPSAWPSAAACLLLIGLLFALAITTGCNFAGLLVAPLQDVPDRRNVTAEYTGLQNRTVAVLVNADEVTLFGHPNADANVARAVSGRIASLVPGAQVVNPKDIIKFQQDNPYWNTLLYAELIKKLDVDRVVSVDLVDYTTNEPGNVHVMRGRVSANIGVIERAGTQTTTSDPDNLAYAKLVTIEFPKESTVGVVNADRQTIELGMLDRFSREVAHLFADHVIEVED